ncbi:diaminopropionate ammonia-lyase [Paracraurococcus ruber]|uniref:Diaminopropionate ammonia-lyase n=1 Tax=Paracraurococcus ruber TaxID=77675 RepID=A0ABS1D0F2_9PROT|nr:diaminopropionate ammonia-lyase [Paracraurococcus ruber]MBK1660237.1 diaminopropionate ammonia-lyase [Paracraurococcus ruber]TDG32296.1 diaminopropionate ammonia-lyase [Paracraurococcus ruber]
MTIPRRPYRLLLNRHAGTPGVVVLPEGGFRRAREEITAWPGYAPTPLLPLAELAQAARVAAIHWKDEGPRFGLGSFKALGGAYAVMKLLQAELARRGAANAATAAEMADGTHKDATGAITVTCATDGNHGRSVAWGAQRFRCRCVIFVHEGVSQGRRDAIARYGAEIRVVPGTYDDAVRAAQRTAEAEAWFVVSDTSYPGYTEVPRDVMQGYRLMAEEAAEAIPEPPTHVFIQGGVGGVAAAVSVQMRARYGTRAPRLVVVEPDRAACLLASAEAGRPVTVEGDLDTLMAGLACGEPSLLAWQELERAAFAWMAVPDESAVDCMRLLARRTPKLEAGESAVAGLAALLLLARDPFGRAALGLEEGSRVLLFGTEGATDPELYARLTA